MIHGRPITGPARAARSLVVARVWESLQLKQGVSPPTNVWFLLFSCDERLDSHSVRVKTRWSGCADWVIDWGLDFKQFIVPHSCIWVRNMFMK